jgi:hypothetical protein
MTQPPVIDAVGSIGSATNPVTDPATPRPVGHTVVHWVCADGVLPANALPGDAIAVIGESAIYTPVPTPEVPEPPPVLPTGPDGNWSLVFNDEFTEPDLDPNHWIKYWYEGIRVNGLYTPASNVSIVNDQLVLTRSDANNGACVCTRPADPVHDPNSTRPGFQIATESCFEARIKFPGNGRNKLYNWPAFWVLEDQQGGVNPNTLTCEIDVVDVYYPYPQTAYILDHKNVHVQTYQSTYYGDAFHVWTMHRGQDFIDVFLDGALVCHTPVAPNDPEGNAPQYILINVGTSSQGGPSQTGAASNVVVDYVRAWQPA